MKGCSHCDWGGPTSSLVAKACAKHLLFSLIVARVLPDWSGARVLYAQWVWASKSVQGIGWGQTGWKRQSTAWKKHRGSPKTRPATSLKPRCAPAMCLMAAPLRWPTGVREKQMGWTRTGAKGKISRESLIHQGKPYTEGFVVG